MRRILIENARRKQRDKHGGRLVRRDLDQIDVAAADSSEDLLSLEEALQKLTAADATAAQLVSLGHAHHKGVIHRDIKPSNVLVTLHDSVPVVKVIDFGVAKATGQKLTERTLFTAYGQMIGSPLYMSPEQAEMSGRDIDTRSDVYSLGVLLYEFLTGTTPLESKRLREAGYAELQRLIREEEAPRPSNRLSSLGDSATVLAGNRGLDVKRLVRLLASDLDWVVMKALEKDRRRRYDTPGHLAEDIERYLRREPILARPPSAMYKLKKFLQRYWLVLLPMAIILGMSGVLNGLVAPLLLRHFAPPWWVEEREEHQRTQDKAERALADAVDEKKAKEAAQTREAETRSLLDFSLRRFLQTRDVAGCRTAAEMWEKLNREDAESLYIAARMRAVTAAVIRAGDPSPQGAKQADAEAERAMIWLKRAVAAGYKDAAHIETDPLLDSLRDRPDFEKLVAGLQAGPPVKKPE